jgi:hypothetical protein
MTTNTTGEVRKKEVTVWCPNAKVAADVKPIFQNFDVRRSAPQSVHAVKGSIALVTQLVTSTKGLLTGSDELECDGIVSLQRFIQ